VFYLPWHLERVEADLEFRRKVTACKDEKSRIDFVTSHGFEFTKEEIDLVKSELSEEDISNLAGGSCLFHVGIQFQV